MLDKTTIDFLIFLRNKSKISINDYFKYFKSKKTNNWITINTFIFLNQNGFILKKGNYIYPSFETEILINQLNENKRSAFFYNHVLPYIQNIIIYLLGLLSPLLTQWLLKLLNL